MISLSSLPFYNSEDDQFSLTLFDFMNGGSINFDPDRLAQLKFNPLLCESYKNFSLCKDNDPDMNFYLENSSCEYYAEDSFNNMLAEEQSRLDLNCSNLESGLSFLHMNIRSISNKFVSLTNFLSQLRVKLPIVGISEAWLDVNCYHFSDIAGYNFLHKPGVNCVGGGVGHYIGEHLNYKKRPDLAFPVDGSAESLFVEINRTKEKNLIVDVLYRPPDSNLNEFLSDLDHVLEKLPKKIRLYF